MNLRTVALVGIFVILAGATLFCITVVGNTLAAALLAWLGGVVSYRLLMLFRS